MVASNPNLAFLAFPLEKNNGVLSSISDKINFFYSRGDSIITADSNTVLGIEKKWLLNCLNDRMLRKLSYHNIDIFVH